jgi:hypothetical protein
MALHQLRERYRHVHTEKSFYPQLLIGAAIFLGSLGANAWANFYTSTGPVNVVQDLLLDLLPIVNLNFIYIEGALILIVLSVFLALYRPQRLPFLLKTVGLFIFIRSFFMILTHLSLPLPEADIAIYAPPGSLTRFLSSGNDLFFSGHTGFPFLLSLIFWKDALLRYIFLGASLFFGTAVLLAHVHYSIDVFAAFFITYAIYDGAVWLFTKDHALFHLLQITPEK